MAKDGKYFKAREFACKCGMCQNKVEQRLIDLCDDIREAYGSAIKVNSGYRCPSHNAHVGGAKHSQHMAGVAADLAPMDGDIGRLQKLILEKFSKRCGGIGLYDRFVHVDLRLQKSRWDYRTKKQGS